MRPWFLTAIVNRYGEFSHQWYRAQQLAFAEAMKNNPTERPR